MGLGYALGNRQAETGAAAVSGPTLVEAHEPAYHVAAPGDGDAGPVVVDDDHDVLALDGDHRLHGRLGVAGGVGHEVVDRPLDGYGAGYQKFTRRAEDWAMVGVAAIVKKADDGSCADVRIGLTHMGTTPVRATTAEDALRGGALDADAIAAAAHHAAEGTHPPGDLNATPDYKRHLARVLTRRALEEAAGL